MEKQIGVFTVTVMLLSSASLLCAKWDPMWKDYIAAGNKQPPTESIDLAGLGEAGVRILEDYSGKPDEFGILKRYELHLPDLLCGSYFSGDHHPEVNWPDGANRIQPWIFDTLKELCSEGYARRPSNYPRVREGMFLLLKLRDGRYLAVVPIAGPLSMSWLYANEQGRLVLNFGTLGTKPISCDAPLFAWCYSNDIYAASRRAWALAITCEPVAGSTYFRMNKQYPDVFRYLGWCSWEQYKWDISEDILAEGVEQIENSGLPVRYMLVDDGHLDRRDKKLRSFFPDANKFPHGWSKLLSMRKDDKIRWMGQWNTVSGYWFTVARDHRLGELINSNLIANNWMDGLVPANSRASCELFYKAHVGAVRAYGFDFIKIDGQSRNLCWYIGGDNAVEAAVNNQLGLEEAANDYSAGMINCMAHGLPCVFNTRYSAVTRCSIDYKVGKEARGKSHDMFHSSDPAAGRIMAVSKAMSAGPVYLSDDPKKFVHEYIRPLCYQDGRLLRPIAPAAPLPDSVFLSPMRQMKPYRVIAPLKGGAAAVVVYNLYHPSPDQPLKATVGAGDYVHASCMIQPYPGKWTVPAEGLFIYDRYARTGRKLDQDYCFELRGFDDRLLHLCPITEGWAAIGRTDKFLSPAAVEIISVTPDELNLCLKESGPFALYLADGAPSAPDISFEHQGPGLWKADLLTGEKNVTLKIKRIPSRPK